MQGITMKGWPSHLRWSIFALKVKILQSEQQKMCAKQWREIWWRWLTFSSCSSSPLLKFFSSSAFLMRTVPYVELCDEQFENFSKHESLAMYSRHQVCDHHRKKVKFTFPLTEKKTAQLFWLNWPWFLCSLNPVDMKMLQSWHLSVLWHHPQPLVWTPFLKLLLNCGYLSPLTHR